MNNTAVNTPVSNQTGTPTTTVGQVAKAALPTVVQVSVESYQGKSVGSGVILSSDGLILTNNHVITDATNGNGQITITFNNGKTTQASHRRYDSGSDLAVIKAQSVSGLPTASLGDSSKIQVGDTVVAIGSPDGLQSTVTSGIVSALNRQVTVSSESASRFSQRQPGHLQRDPDRRQPQPRQQRRPAVERAGPGHRHQLGDLLADQLLQRPGRQRRPRVLDPDRPGEDHARQARSGQMS